MKIQNSKAAWANCKIERNTYNVAKRNNIPTNKMNNVKEQKETRLKS